MLRASLKKDPPANPGEWHTRMNERNLAGQTVHGRSLASASQMGYEQFLLLRVLWKVDVSEEPDIERLSTLLGLDGDVERAEVKLGRYKSWQEYFNGFSDSKISEGTFALVHHYRLEVAKTDWEAESLHFFTPISKRTRSQATQSLQNRMQNLHLETPTRASRSGRGRIVPRTPMDSFHYSDDEDDEEDDECQPDSDHGNTDEESSPPFQPETPMSPEQARLFYPATKDEQIVNASLLVFLNALTVHFDDVSSNWTLHRKAFKAKFEGAEYEARTDGYLHDNRGNTKVLLEVKPGVRNTKLSLIQIQESAQMVAWIASDNPAAQEAHKTYVGTWSAVTLLNILYQC